LLLLFACVSLEADGGVDRPLWGALGLATVLLLMSLCAFPR
jgi:hypothetical protein